MLKRLIAVIAVILLTLLFALPAKAEANSTFLKLDPFAFWDLKVPTPEKAKRLPEVGYVAPTPTPTPTPVPTPEPVYAQSYTGSCWGYYYGQCTCYASSRRPDLPHNLGNASDWLARASAQGYATGSEPALGAVVQLRESWWGHVAIVDGVGSTWIYISEQNAPYWNTETHRTLSRWDWKIVGYIY